MVHAVPVKSSPDFRCLWYADSKSDKCLDECPSVHGVMSASVRQEIQGLELEHSQ